MQLIRKPCWHEYHIHARNINNKITISMRQCLNKTKKSISMEQYFNKTIISISQCFNGAMFQWGNVSMGQCFNKTRQLIPIDKLSIACVLMLVQMIIQLRVVTRWATCGGTGRLLSKPRPILGNCQSCQRPREISWAVREYQMWPQEQVQRHRALAPCLDLENPFQKVIQGAMNSKLGQEREWGEKRKPRWNKIASQ